MYADAFGDVNAVQFNSKHNSLSKRLFSGSYARKFLNRMKKQLTNSSNKCAFVCNISSFCNIFEQEQWLETLGELKNLEGRTGTIVLVAPPIAERSRGLLLNSPVFETLGDNVILDARCGEIMNFYLTLKNGKGEGCVFLNSYTKERISALLLHCIMEQDLFYTDGELDIMADYLVQYLNNRILQWEDRIFEKDFNLLNPLYSSLFSRLLKPEIWSRFINIIESVKTSGGLKNYLNNKNVRYAYNTCSSVRIVYEEGSFAWDCMTLYPAEFSSGETSLDLQADKILLDIYNELLIHQNKEENRQIAQSIKDFLIELGNAVHQGDYDTYKRVLYSIQFCVKCICASDEEYREIEKIILALKRYTELSRVVFNAMCICSINSDKEKSGLAEAAADKLMAKYIAEKTLLSNFDSSIEVQILNFFSGKGNINDINAVLDNLKKDITEKQEPEKSEYLEIDDEDMEEELYIKQEMYGNAPNLKF